MILFNHPLWRYIAPYAHVDEHRSNVDFLQVPDDLRTIALEAVCNCIACGAVIHPLRARAKSERSRVAGTAIERRLFYAPTCPTEVNSGCSRTVAARAHKQKLRAIFGLPSKTNEETSEETIS